MTIQEMHTEFNLLMDKAGGAGAPSFLVSEIDIFLNAAIERFVTKRAFGNNARRTGFEEDQKRRDDLRNLIANYQYTVPQGALPENSPNKDNGVMVKLPKDYRHAISEECTILFKNETINKIGVKPITYDRYNSIIKDPFNSPNENLVYRLDYGGSISEGMITNAVELIASDNVTITTYFLRYLKNPNVVSFSGESCNLAKHTHREIVRMAVVEALENIESPRYQSSKIELNEIE